MQTATETSDNNTLALRLAYLRWGRGWDGRPQAPCCTDRTLWRRRGRPRVFGCSGCGAEHSVTAGTFMHGAKIQLVDIADLVRAHDTPLPPSARGMAAGSRLTLPTVWSWCMRIKSAVANLGVVLADIPFVHGWCVPVRGPHPRTPAPVPDADPETRASVQDRGPVWISAADDALGRTAFLCGYTNSGIARRLQVRQELLKTPQVWRIPTDANVRLWSHGVSLILDVHRSVSARWLPRYLGFANQIASTRRRKDGLWHALLDRAPSSFAQIRPAGASGCHLDRSHHPVLEHPRPHGSYTPLSATFDRLRAQPEPSTIQRLSSSTPRRMRSLRTHGATQRL